RLLWSEAPAVHGVDDVRNSRPAGGDAPENARLGRVRVHDVGPVAPEEAPQPPQGDQVEVRAHLPHERGLDVNRDAPRATLVVERALGPRLEPAQQLAREAL